MIRKCIFILAASLFSMSAAVQAQDEPTYTKLDGHMFSKLSGSGKWAIENLDAGRGANIYNVEEGTITTYEEVQCNGISDDGIMVGQESRSIPVVAIDGQWEKLPYPNDPEYLTGTAWDITNDGTMICGALTFKNKINQALLEIGTIRKPCI